MFSIQKIYDVSLFILIISLSFSSALPNICLGILILLFLYRFIKKERDFTLKIQNISFILLFFYLVLKQIIATKFSFEDFDIYSRFLIILILPFLLQGESKTKIAISVVISSFFAMFIALFNTFFYYIKNNELPFANGEIVNKILAIDRPYLGFYCLIGIIMCFYLVRQLPKYRTLFFIISFILSVFILLIVARLSLLTGMLLGFIYLLFYSQLTIVKKIILFSSSLLMISLVILSYKNMTNRFFTNTSMERIKLYDPRVDIWDCAYKISQENEFNVFFGCKSHQEVSNKLVECYGTKSENDPTRRQWFIDSRFNTHNQFIDFYLVGGLIGLVLFIYLIYDIIKGSINNFYFFSLVISLVLFLFFENVFQRQLGCFLTGITLFLVSNNKSLVNK
jgi:O-antigen ligase